ncbi:hypothetical protein CIL05_16080 [Virgibacillus profundi]|uniref:DUF3889 domain-containing protein n=1 Tax=Virgibacillus profundi TaxID=2024555 RepID=A0A2A2IAW0_9BACI|nr:DUF3889 domain-containing protein [Virgibacillus profundi]PAV28456.1 hypothetical protein CIL05_16080 [Virgibacillus profundi]PXY52629.1 DUF3889 domain-containing protein [Virgibacillus profundi]
MRRLFLAASITFLLTSGYITSNHLHHHTVSAENEIPPYAKWGQLAVKETKSKYPNAQVIDYLHIGRETKDDSMVEKFKLWLKEESKEYGVFINIEFNSQTDEVIAITFRESLN